MPIRVAVPTHLHLQHFADLPGLNQLLCVNDVRHTTLLGADLDDAFCLRLGIQNRFALTEFVREWFFDIDIFARL